MKETFQVIKSGTNGDAFWFLIQRKDSDGFIASALVKNEKDISKDGKIAIPKAIVDKIQFKY